MLRVRASKFGCDQQGLISSSSVASSWGASTIVTAANQQRRLARRQKAHGKPGHSGVHLLSIRPLQHIGISRSTSAYRASTSAYREPGLSESSVLRLWVAPVLRDIARRLECRWSLCVTLRPCGPGYCPTVDRPASAPRSDQLPSVPPLSHYNLNQYNWGSQSGST